VRVLTILISPVLTNGSQTIIKQMRFTPEQLSFENIKKYEILFGHQVVKEFAPIYVRYNI
jgi:methionyl-tRNA synthetase